MIEDVLRDLEHRLEGLGVGDEWRQRIVAEAGDHLAEAAEAAGEEGATLRFGNVETVAALVAAGLAGAKVRRGTYRAFAALAAAGIAFVGLLALVPAAGGWPDMFDGRIRATGPIAALALFVFPQVAFVSGCLALAQAHRLRRADACPEAELQLLRRRGAVALACGEAALLALALSAFDLTGVLAAWWVWVTVSACLVLSVPLAFAGVGIAHSAAPRALSEGRAGDVFQDFAPVFALDPIRRLDLPAHPLRFAALAAVAVWLAGLVFGWYAEGDAASGVVRGTFEAVALLICFAVLGRRLGLRRSRR